MSTLDEKNNNMIDETATISDCTLENNINIYKYSVLTNSHISNNSVVGDFSKIVDSKLGDLTQINRYNYLNKSIIGRHTYTGMNSLIINSTIGKFCSISWRVTIGPANHNYHLPSTHSFIYDDFHKMLPPNHNVYDRFFDDCTVGNDVWIGCNSTILRGINIGDGSVIGANSLVNKDVPPYSIVVGSPAKIVKMRFNESIINEMLELKWWNWSDQKIKDNFKFFEKNPSKKSISEII